MANRDTLALIAQEFGCSFELLNNAIQHGGLRDLLYELGWDFATVPGELASLANPVRDVVALVAGGEVDPAQVGNLLTALASVFDTIAALKAEAGLPAEFKNEFPRQILDYLFVRHLVTAEPRWGYLLAAVGLVRIHDIAETATRPSYHSYAFRLEDITSFLTNPLGYLKSFYRWGQSDFAGEDLLGNAGGLLSALGLDVRFQLLAQTMLQYLKQGALAPSDCFDAELHIPLFENSVDPSRFQTGSGLFLLPETASKKPGFALLPFISAGFGRTFQLANDLALEFKGTVDLSSGVAILVRPNEDVQFVSGIAGGGTPVTGNLVLSLILGQPGEPMLLLGKPDGTRLELAGISTSAGTRFDGAGKFDVFAEFALEGGKLAIKPSAGEKDGFLAKILPESGIEALFEMAVGFSTVRGFYFKGSGGFEIVLPINRDIGPVRLQTATLSVHFTNAGIPIYVAVDAAAALGPVTAAVEKVGLKADLAFRGDNKGNLGIANLDLKFKPPTGVGIAIKAGPVSGGGFVSLDYEAGRYFGALELTIYAVSVKAFGIIETKFPDGQKGFSFLIIISAEFTPIQLGFGFTLNGVGGLAGIHRTVDTEGLLAAVRAGRLSNVLFPHDVVKNAPAIMHDLQAIFPASEGHYIFGPMAKIGWGTPTLVEGTIGIVLELPGPRLAILGTVRAALPTKEAPVVELNMDVGGVLDFPKKSFALDASLHDSRIALFALEGDMSMRMSWGHNPNFAIAIGGFNPHFTPPPGFPAMRRVSVALGLNGNPTVRFSGYMALTSNSAQIGARLEAKASKCGAELSGFLGFDALFIFSPFSFIVELEGGVKVTFHGVGFSLHFRGEISGPTPWRINGKVCVSVLFWDACVGFAITLGGEKKETLPGIDPWTGATNPDGTAVIGLQSALQNPANWGGEKPAGAFPAVTMAAAPEGAPVPIDPLGQAIVRQKAVPLDMTIARFAGGTPPVKRKFVIERVTIGQNLPAGQLVPPGPDNPAVVVIDNPPRVSDLFAPAQFQEMKDADKLSSPSFVQLPAGFSVSSDALTYGTLDSEGLTYDTVVLDGGTETVYAAQFDPSKDHVTTVTARSAAAVGGIHRAAQAEFVDPNQPPKVTFVDEGYVLASTSTLKVAAGFDLAAPLPRPMVTEALATAIAANPTARRTLQVTPSFIALA